MVFDIETGKVLPHLPDGKHEPEVVEHAAPPPEPAKPKSEVVILFTSLGPDAGYADVIKHLPPEFGASFSPYTPDSFEASMQESEKGRAVYVDIPTTGKLAIGATDSEFKQQNKLEATISRVYDPAGIFAGAKTEALQKFANSKEILLITPENAFVIAAISTFEEIKQKVASAEAAAISSGYALIIVEPNPDAAKYLDNWSGSLAEKNIKIVQGPRE